MGLSGKIFCLTKMSRRRGFSKKRRFLQFSIAAPKKISNGCQSDNFDPRRSVYGPFESLCPKFSETHAGKVSIFKIVGARPLRSQVIRKSCRLKRCFSAIFERKCSVTAKPSIFDPIVLYIFGKLSIWGFRKSGWNSIFDILWVVRYLGTGWGGYVCTH